MRSELEKLKQLTEALTSNGYLTDQTHAWKYAFDSVSDLVCITNLDFKIKFLNKPLIKKLKCKEDTFLNQSIKDIFKCDKFPFNFCDKLVNVEEIITYKEKFIEFLDGWFEGKRYLIRDQEDKLIGYTFMLRETTENRLIEQALKSSEERFKGIFNYTKSGIVVYSVENDGKDFICKYINKASLLIENIKKEDVVGKNIIDVFPGIKDFGIYDVFRRVWFTGKAEYKDTSLYKDNRITGWRSNYVYKLPTGEIVTVYSDETKRKLLEIEAKEANILLEGVLDAIPDIISVQDTNHNIIKYNKAAKELFNITSKDLKDKKCFNILGRDFNCDNCQTNICKNTGKPAELVRYINELNGWYNCRSYPIFDADGKIINIIEHLRRINDKPDVKKDS